MDFSFKKDSVIFAENNLNINKAGEYLRRSGKIDFVENADFKTIDSFVSGEVDLFWPYLGNGVSPKVISRDVSICILYKIIGDRRMFEGFFAGLNSKEIFIAQKIYSIMMEAAKHNIPAVEVSPLIERFKRGIVKSNIYVDISNVIREYRSVLELFGAVDMPLILEKYSELLKKDQYSRYLAKKKFFVLNKTYENRAVYSKIKENTDLAEQLKDGEILPVKGVEGILDLCTDCSMNSEKKAGECTAFKNELNISDKRLEDLKIEKSDEENCDAYLFGDYIIRKIDICNENEVISSLFDEEIIEEKKYETVDMSEIRKNATISELNGYKYSGKVVDMDFENYFEMEIEAGRILQELHEQKTDLKDIALIVPRMNSAVSSMVEKTKENYNLDIEQVSEANKINTSRAALAAVIAYAVRNDYSSILNEDDQVEFVKFVLDGIVRNRGKKVFPDASLVDDDMYAEFEEEMSFIGADEVFPIYEDNFESNGLYACEDSEVYTEETSSDNTYEKRFGIDLYKIEEKNINYIYIRKNISRLMRIILDDERILPAKPEKEESISEYIKKFYKLYADIDEQSINQVSQICDLLKDLSCFSNKEEKKFFLSEEKKLEYIKNYLSVYTSSRRRIERTELENIAVVTYKEYVAMKLDKKIKIIFDAQSPLYDDRIEDELNTKIAYLGDKILSEIHDDAITKRADSKELGKLHNRLLDRNINGKLSILLGNEKEDDRIYILSSYTSLGGYEQENRFYEKLTDTIK